jgi:uncharacterized protein
VGEIEAVEDFRRRIGVPGLVDVHTHFMPERVLGKVWEYFDVVGPATGIEWGITYRQEEGERIALLRQFGVHAFTAMLYPHKRGMASWLNEWAADFAGRTPDCLHTATLYPEDGVAEYVRTAVEAGARVFKSHLQVGRTTRLTSCSIRCGGRWPRRESPWSCTAGQVPYPANTRDPSRWGGSSPGIRACAWSWRTWGCRSTPISWTWPSGMTRCAWTRRWCSRISASASPPFPVTELGRLADLGDRILLGTDFPNIPYPYVHQLEVLERLGLGEQ